jgi:Fe-S cluster assembly scaffold protein SufB
VCAHAAPNQASLDEVDPKLLETFSKLGIPISEQKRLAGVKNVAYDYVFDSESIATTFKKELAAQVRLPCCALCRLVLGG